MEDLISLDDFDPGSRVPPFLNSPTSLEACKMYGLEPEDLLLLTPAEHKHVFCRDVSEEAAAHHYAKYCKRREDDFKRVSDQRKRLQRNSISTISRAYERSRSPLKGSVNQDMLQVRELERLERNQQIELKMLLHKEISKEKIKKDQLKAEINDKERSQSRMTALATKQIELETKRLLDNERRKLKALQDEKERKLRAELEAEKERIRLLEEAENQRVLREEAMAQEELRRQKRLAKVYVAAKTLEEQKFNAIQRASQLLSRERKRKEMLDEQARLKANKIKQLSEQKQKRLQSVRQTVELQLLHKQLYLTEKQKQSEEKLRLFEQKRAQRQENARLRAEKKEDEIRRIRFTNELLEEQKRQALSVNISRAEERHVELMTHLEAKLQNRLLKSIEKQCRTEMIQSSIGEMEALRSEQILEKQAKREEKVEAVRRQLLTERQKKAEIAKLKEVDSQLTKQRTAKMQEYRRRLVLDKIQEEDLRMKQLKAEKEQLQAQKQALREQVEIKKARILEGFTKLKLGAVKLDRLDLFNHLDDLTSIGSASSQQLKPRTQDNHYHEARLEIERIKQSQAEELLAVIQSEEHKEATRLQNIAVAPTEQQDELEKVSGELRMQATHKIEALSM